MSCVPIVVQLVVHDPLGVVDAPIQSHVETEGEEAHGVGFYEKRAQRAGARAIEAKTPTGTPLFRASHSGRSAGGVSLRPRSPDRRNRRRRARLPRAPRCVARGGKGSSF